jgi:hypothetical protein
VTGMSDVLINLFSPSVACQVSTPGADLSNSCSDAGTFDDLLRTISEGGIAVAGETYSSSTKGDTLTPVVEVRPCFAPASADELHPASAAGNILGLMEELLTGIDVDGLLAVGGSSGSGKWEFVERGGSCFDAGPLDPMTVGSEVAAQPQTTGLLLGVLSLAVLNLTAACQQPEKHDIEVTAPVTEELPGEDGEKNESSLTDATSASLTVTGKDAPAMELMALLVVAALQFGSAPEEQAALPALSGDVVTTQVVAEIGDGALSLLELPETGAAGGSSDNAIGDLGLGGRLTMSGTEKEDFLSLLLAASRETDGLPSSLYRQSGEELPVSQSEAASVLFSRATAKLNVNDHEGSLANTDRMNDEVRLSAKDRFHQLFDRVITTLTSQASNRQATEEASTMGQPRPELSDPVKPDSRLSPTERFVLTTAKAGETVGGEAFAAGDSPTHLKGTDMGGNSSDGREAESKGISFVSSAGLTGEKKDNSPGNKNGDSDRQSQSDAYGSILRSVPPAEQGQRNGTSEVQARGAILNGFDRFEKMAEQLSGKSGIHDLIVKLEVGNNESVVVALKDLGQSVSVEVKGSNQALVSFLQAQKETITRQLEGKDLRTIIYVDPNASNTSDRQERKDTKRRSFERERQNVRSFGSVVETFV